MKKILIIALAAFFGAFASGASAQTFANRNGKIILAGSGGTDLTNTLTFTTTGTALVSPQTYTFPTPTSGLFHSTAGGVLSLGAVALGSNGIGGDVSGILLPANGGSGVANTSTFNWGSNNITFTTGGVTNITLPTSGTLIASGSTAGGDLSGTYPNPTVAKINGNTIPVNAAGVLANDGSGNLSWAATSGTNTGDVTLAGENYLTIAAQVITAHPINLSGSNVTSILGPSNGGTGVNNGSNTITLANNFSTSGNFPLTLTTTALTNVTFPTSGTLIASGSTAGGDLSGTYPNPTVASINGNVIPANAAGALVNNGTGTLSWTPIPTGSGTSSGTNTGDVTLAGETYLTIAAQVITAHPINLSGSNVTSILGPSNGGTGVNNGSNTITLANNLSTVGNFPLTLTTTALTNVTFPTSGTLIASGSTAGGDLSGTYPNPTVSKLLGNAIPVNAAGVLTNDGSGVLSWSASGSGLSGLTANGAMYATGATTAASTAALTNGQLLIGSTGLAPVASTLTAGSNITITNTAGTITIASTASGSLSSMTVNGAVYATSATAGTSSAALTDGQLLVGSSIGVPTAANITAGSNISVTNGHNSISIAATIPGGLTGFATPSANSVNISAPTAGAATTAMRSDATLQLDQSIAPTWTGAHIFSNTVNVNNTTTLAKTFATTEVTNSTAFAATQDNVAFDGGTNQASWIRLGGAPAAGFTITSIANPVSGKRLSLYNATAQTMTIANQSAAAGATAANKIITGTGADVSIPTGGSVDLVYSAAEAAGVGRWILKSSSNGNGSSPVTGILFARKTANVSLTASNTNLQTDPDLKLTLLPNSTYEFSGVIVYNGAAATSDLKLGVAFSGTTTSIRWSAIQGGTAMAPSSVTSAATAATAGTVGTDVLSPFTSDVTFANELTVYITGIIQVGATGGTLQILESQATSQATQTSVRLNSTFKATRVQ